MEKVSSECPTAVLATTKEVTASKGSWVAALKGAICPSAVVDGAKLLLFKTKTPFIGKSCRLPAVPINAQDSMEEEQEGIKKVTMDEIH